MEILDSVFEWLHIFDWAREMGEPGLPLWAKWLMLSGSFFFIEYVRSSWIICWFGVGAVAASLAAFVFPGVLVAQIAVFALVSGLLIIFSRSIVDRFLCREKKITNIDAIIGKEGLCTEDISNHDSKGELRLQDILWRARSFDDDIVIGAGERVRVIDRDGNTLIVELAPTQIESLRAKRESKSSSVQGPNAAGKKERLENQESMPKRDLRDDGQAFRRSQ